MKSKTLRLFNNCFIVKGYSRSLIFDSLRQTYYIVPHSLIKFLQVQISKKDSHLSPVFTSNITKEYSRFIIQNKLGSYMDEMEERLFSYKMNLEYCRPSTITNLILLDSQYFNDKIFGSIKRLNIEAILILIKSKDDYYECLLRINDLLQYTPLTHVDIIIEKINGEDKNKLESFFINAPRINSLLCQSKTYYTIKLKSGRRFMITNKKIEICGSLTHTDFIKNIDHFTESLRYNTCLNRKVCIDEKGYIKNCPNSELFFGNVKNSTLEEIICQDDFKKWWNIKKDNIDVCKDCEFRHLCTDCRMFIRDPENIFSHPSKCKYNPYICSWEWEEKFVPIDECGTYSKETGFIVNKKKVNLLNKEIWGE